MQRRIQGVTLHPARIRDGRWTCYRTDAVATAQFDLVRRRRRWSTAPEVERSLGREVERRGVSVHSAGLFALRDQVAELLLREGDRVGLVDLWRAPGDPVALANVEVARQHFENSGVDRPPACRPQPRSGAIRAP